MTTFLHKLMVDITRKPRQIVTLGVDFEWSPKSWTHNVFRTYELVFGRRKGIKEEMTTVLETDKNGATRFYYICHSFESCVALTEQYVREFLAHFKITPFKIYVPVLQTVGGTPVFSSPYLFAIAFDNAGDSGEKANTTPWSFSFTATGSNLSMVSSFVNWNNSGTVSVSSVTYNSVSFTFGINQTAFTPADYIAQQYYLASPATGANTASVAFTGNSYGRMGMTSFSGTNTASPKDNTAVAHTAGATSLSGSITTNFANSFIVDVIGCDNATLGTLASSQTTEWVTSTTDPRGSSRKATTTAGSYSMAWSWTTSSEAGNAIIAIRELAAAAVNSGFFFAAAN